MLIRPMMFQGAVAAAATVWSATDRVNATLSSDALTATGANAGSQIRGATSKNSGKWYLEFLMTRPSNTNSIAVGVMDQARSLSSAMYYGEEGSGGGYATEGVGYLNRGTNVAAYVTGDTIALAIDFDALRIQYYRNNASVGSTTFASGLTLKPFMSANKSTLAAKLVATGQLYAPPAGFSPWG